MRSWIVGIVAASVLWLGAVARADDLVVAADHTVTIEYKLTLPDKSVVATSEGGEPMQYVHGRKQLLTKLEEGLAGMKIGERKRIEINPQDGYGEYDDKKRLTVERDKVPADVEVGANLLSKEGQAVIVLEVSDENAVLDTNHPMAGKTLIFDVEIAKIAKAPPDAAPAAENKATP